jgi:hypothetical protein
MEKAFPYIEIVNIEVVFPNNLLFTVLKEKKCLLFATKTKTFICDEKLKILKIEPGEYLSSQSNSIEVINSEYLDKTYEAGEFFGA